MYNSETEFEQNKHRSKGTTIADCPSCGNTVNVGATAHMGQLVTCRSCKTELEVVWLDPVELDWPYVDDFYEGDDDDDDDDDDFDFDEDDDDDYDDDEDDDY